MSEYPFVPLLEGWKGVLAVAEKDYSWICSGKALPSTFTVANHVIQYPIGDNGVDVMKSVATVAPFGKGKKTVVDEKVRKGLQIDPSLVQFRFENLWNKQLEHISAELCNTFKENKVKLVFYKLLLYEEGGHFSAHMDTLRAKTHIASLLISLPTEDGCEGGVLRVKDTNSNVEIAWDGQCADLEASWCSFYTDCVHELSLVTKGKRVVLVYEVHSVPEKKNSNKVSNKAKVEDNVKVPYVLPLNIVDDALAVKDNVLILLNHMYSSRDSKDLKGFDRTLYEIIKFKYGENFDVLIEDLDLRIDLYEERDRRNYAIKMSGCDLRLARSRISRFEEFIAKPKSNSKENETEENDDDIYDFDYEEYEFDGQPRELRGGYYFQSSNYICLFDSDDFTAKGYNNYEKIRHLGNEESGSMEYNHYVIRVSKRSL